ncbi:MAG: TIGR00180 family glycosyltransferase [Proteobacteria bacterium]|nr:TIGR00180 family glycosyltransferase [Pseudomonadota bacterium]
MTRPSPESGGAGGELTIVLTLKDRVPYTRRWMEYADSSAFPFKVLVADGGSDDGARSLLSDKARYPNVDYEYVRYSADRTYADYYSKMADALGRVRTPFVALADNDDFIVAESLRKSVRFLSANGDYFSCGGQGAIFWMGRQPDAGPALHGREVEWKCTREMRSIDGDTARARLRTVSVSKSDTFYYDVKRTAETRRHFEIVRDLNLNDLFLVEHLVWYLAAIAGKTKRLEHLHLARQQDAPGSSGAAHAQRFGDWFGRMLVASWSEDFGKFVEAAGHALAEADKITNEEAVRCVIDTYRAAVAPALLSDLMNEPTISPSMPAVVGLVRRLVNLPEGSVLRRAARALYRRLGWISLDIVYGTEYFSIPVPDARRDFRPIREFLARRN